jgi:hypothetical protein
MIHPRPIRANAVLFLLASLAAIMAPADDGPLSAEATRRVLERLAAACAQIETLQVAFRQEKHLALFPEPVAADGQLYFRRPASIRLDTTRPFRSVAIVSAAEVARYEWQGDAWHRLNLGNPIVLRTVLNQMAAWLRGDLRGDDRQMAVTARQAGETTVLFITPVSVKLREVIDHIELTLSPDGTRVDTVRIVESPENFTVMRFAEEKRNVVLAEQTFATDLPQPVPAPGGE